MARSKVRLTYIQNGSKRRTTYRKRKVGLVKKLDELTTLCAIEACCIIYSIFDPEPTIWPSSEEAHRLITKFRSSSVRDQVKRNVNQETFTRQMLHKMEEKLRKVQGENRLKEITQILYQSTMNLRATLSRMDIGDIEDLSRVIKQNLIDIERMMEFRVRQDSSFNPLPAQQLVLSHHDQSSLSNQYGRFPLSRPRFTMPIMTFPPPLSMGFPSTNMEVSPRVLPQDGSQQLVLSNEFDFIPPNYDQMFQSWNPSIFMSNMTFPPPPGMNFPTTNIEFSLPPPQGGTDSNDVGGGGQQLVLSNEFESMPPNYDRFQSLNPGFAMPNMDFPPPIMPFSFPSMDFSGANMDPNMGMPYPSNHPMFPNSPNADMGPHDSNSSH